MSSEMIETTNREIRLKTRDYYRRMKFVYFLQKKKQKKNAFEMCLFFAVFFLMTGGHFNNTSEALLKIMKIVYFSTYSVIDAKCLTLVRVKTNIRLVLTNAIEIF